MEKTIDEIMQEERANLAAKEAEFEAKGKKFILREDSEEYRGHGPGLVPQDIHDEHIRPVVEAPNG